MARRRRNNDSPIADLVGILVIGGGISLFGKVQDLTEQYSYLGPLIIAVGIGLAGLYIWWRIQRFLKKRRAEKAFTIANIDTMDGVKFEYYLAKVLKSRGYTNVRVTEKYDLGVDIVATKDGVTWGIQAKRYKFPVKVNAVRQAYTALTRYKCDRAMVITNSSFTRPALELANDTKTVLVGRQQLKDWVLEYSQG